MVAAIRLFNTFGKENKTMEKENQIYSLSFDVNLSVSIGEDHALTEAESCCVNHVIPAVNEVVSRYGDSFDAEIESIDVDLGVVSRKDIPTKVKSLLEDEIIRHLYYHSQGQAGEMVGLGIKDAKYSSVQQTGVVSRKDIPTKVKSLLEDEIIRHLYYHSQGQAGEMVGLGIKDAKYSSVQQTKDTRLSYFGVASGRLSYLFEGILPWQYAGSEQAFLSDLWDEVSRILENSSQSDLFFDGLFHEPLAAYRFVNLLNTAQLEVLLSSPVFMGKDIFQNLLTVLETKVTKESGFSLRQLLSIVAYAMIVRFEERISTQGKIGKQGEFLDEVKDNSFDGDGIFHAAFGPIASENIMLKSLEKNEPIIGSELKFDDLNGFEMVVGDEGVMRILENTVENSSGKGTTTGNENEEARVFIERLKAYEQEMIAQKELLTQAADEVGSIRFCVDDAGLILLHPFLCNLFERLGYLSEEQDFKSIEARERAVHLLRYMAGFNPPYYDCQLLLEKMLCDLPIGFPVSLDIELEKEEITNARQVLEAVCQHWTPLNGISPESLQQSFMKRSCNVVFEDDAWMVRVEGQALDILLDDLPWEISLLLFPWKKEMIMVEWQRE